MLNKQLFRGNGLFNESTAYLLIYNMFYTKQYFWTELCFRVYTGKKCCFIREVTDFLRLVGFSLRHFPFIPIVSLNAD